MPSHIYTIDFETTSPDASEAYAIEVALASPDDQECYERSFIALPEGVTIPPETSAIHHIIDEDLVGAPDWDAVVAELVVSVTQGHQLDMGDVVMVAHNADYERTVLAGTDFDRAQWICTFKCALIAFPDAPSHSNEGLRYWLRLGKRGRSGPIATHSALHDCKVTASLFNALYGWFYVSLSKEGVIGPGASIHSDEARRAIIERMVAISSEIAQLPRCPIGKERGKRWSEIDEGFLLWALRQPDMREDVKHAARKELDRRAGR